MRVKGLKAREKSAMSLSNGAKVEKESSEGPLRTKRPCMSADGLEAMGRCDF